MHSEQRLSGRKLSKAVLELKFMKKSKEKAELQEENEERQNLYQDQLLSLHEGADRIVMINSYYDCMDFLPCRLSFGGMDVDIEKLNEDKLKGMYKVIKAPPPEKITEMDTDVTAQEMAQRYQPTNKYGKRKSDHLDDYDTERERGDNSTNICDAAGESVFRSDSIEKQYENVLKQLKSVGKTRPIFLGIGEGKRKFRGKDKGGGNFRGKDRGGGNFRGKDRGGGNFRGKDRGGGNFRGKDRGGDNSRGRGDSRGRGRGNSRGRGRGNFKGSNHRRTMYKGIDKERYNCKGTDQSKGNFKGNIQSHTIGLFKEDDTDNRHSQNMQTSKKFKFMKQE